MAQITIHTFAESIRNKRKRVQVNEENIAQGSKGEK